MDQTTTNMDVRGMRSMQTGINPNRRRNIIVAILIVVAIVLGIIIHKQILRRNAERLAAEKAAIVNSLVESSKDTQINPAARQKNIDDIYKSMNH